MIAFPEQPCVSFGRRRLERSTHRTIDCNRSRASDEEATRRSRECMAFRSAAHREQVSNARWREERSAERRRHTPSVEPAEIPAGEPLLSVQNRQLAHHLMGPSSLLPVAESVALPPEARWNAMTDYPAAIPMFAIQQLRCPKCRAHEACAHLAGAYTQEVRLLRMRSRRTNRRTVG